MKKQIYLIPGIYFRDGYWYVDYFVGLENYEKRFETEKLAENYHKKIESIINKYVKNYWQ